MRQVRGSRPEGTRPCDHDRSMPQCQPPSRDAAVLPGSAARRQVHTAEAVPPDMVSSTCALFGDVGDSRGYIFAPVSISDDSGAVAGSMTIKTWRAMTRERFRTSPAVPPRASAAMPMTEPMTRWSSFPVAAVAPAGRIKPGLLPLVARAARSRMAPSRDHKRATTTSVDSPAPRPTITRFAPAPRFCSTMLKSSRTSP
ncbi:hypothetical protein SSCI18S_03480 [Sphingobium scionense]